MPKSPERCQQIREEMRGKILHDAMLYFARNGFFGTKMSDLAKYIGIGQGTIYVYFKSKEELFHEIFALINNSRDVDELKMLSDAPISAREKMRNLSISVAEAMEDERYAAKIVLNTQVLLEKNDFVSSETTYRSDLYRYTERIIRQGQQEGSAVHGSPMKLADYYWGVVYLYALKKLFTTNYESITAADLERIVLIDLSSVAREGETD